MHITESWEFKKCPLKIKCLEETQARYCACTKFSCGILQIQNMRVVSGYRTFTLFTVKFDTTFILLKITVQWYIVSVRFRFVWNREYLALLSLPSGRRTEEGKRFDANWRPISPASFHTSLDYADRVRSKQKWNDVYNAEKILILLYVREKNF